MMERPAFFANWKMNLGPTDGRAYVAAFLRFFSPHDDRTVALFPPALTLATARDARADRLDILLGAQNIHSEEKGAFTGENSAPMARDAGAQLVLVGHSERRHIFGETDALLAKKCGTAVRFGLTPVLCVGETLAQRDEGETDAVVLRQLRAGIKELPREAVGGIVIAYEPVWAIGTGRSATPADATATHAVIRTALRGIVGNRADEVVIVYGGSVNRANAKELLDADGVDGLLVGGASLDPEAWAAICRT
jgi:triosephosphate isomerase